MSHRTLWSQGTVVEDNGGIGVFVIAGKGEFDGGSIRGNSNGGAELREHSGMTFAGGMAIQDNGTYGIRAIHTSQVTVFGGGAVGGVTVEGHTEVGLDLAANSQGWIIAGNNRFRNNGTVAYTRSAGILVSGSSQLSLEGGNEVTDNSGAGILADMSSTVEAEGCLISRNSEEGVRVLHMSILELRPGTELEENGEGPLSCDETALVLTDVLRRNRACLRVEGTQP